MASPFLPTQQSASSPSLKLNKTLQQLMTAHILRRRQRGGTSELFALLFGNIFPGGPDGGPGPGPGPGDGDPGVGGYGGGEGIGGSGGCEPPDLCEDPGSA